MTSLSLFPRPLALSAYSAVSGSRMTLCLAISCSALFACRSPPLLSLCLTVLPLEVGMGQAPHIAANDASERSLPGLSPAATASLAALTGPHPYIASSAGQFSSRDASWIGYTDVDSSGRGARDGRAVYEGPLLALL